jgi:penicillin-binding protein 2
MLGRESKIPQAKFSAVQYVILAVFLVLAYGLWSLQVRRSEELVVKADQNRIKRVPLLAPRGKIVDRDGNPIVDSYPSFSALLLRDQMRDLNADAPKIALGLHIAPEDLLDKIRRAQISRLPGFQPIIIKDDITHEDLSFIEAHRDEFPELETLMVHRRRYLKGSSMAHLIGYVGEVSEQMLNTPQFEVYERGNIVGQSGVELQYNDVLMGKDGWERVLVNSKGKEVGRPKSNPIEAPVAGHKLKLTIDLDIQAAAEAALEGKNGAIVAMNPRNGEILAMVSRPTFDPNEFAVRISRDEWNRLTQDPAHPLLNKAIQAQVAPGSVFKIIMSVAGLQEGVAQSLKVNCQGGGIFYGQFHQCWIKERHQVHGVIDVNHAIPQSCDTFFYTLAERLGIEKIAQWATELGIGRKTGIDLPNEVSGIMPSEKWKWETFRQKWYPGEVISVGIGQGAVAASPIQLARAIGGIAMGGTLHRPHVVNPADLPEEFRKNMAFDVPEVEHVPIDPQNWITITDAMAAVLNPGGTGAGSHIQGVDFAGKTGSTQVVSHAFIQAHGANAKQLYKGNGWFAGVTPRRNPEIVVVVFFEGGEHGDRTAPIAAQVIKAYVEKQRRVRSNPLLFSDKADPGSVPMASLWSSPGEGGEAHVQGGEEADRGDQHFQGGTMLLNIPAIWPGYPKTARVPDLGPAGSAGEN